MNCLLNALAMSFGLMCVLSLKVIELLSCCSGRLCASPCMVFQYVLVFFLCSWLLSFQLRCQRCTDIYAIHTICTGDAMIYSTMYFRFTCL